METNQEGIIKVISTRPIPDISPEEIINFPREKPKQKHFKICPKCNQQIDDNLFEQHVSECIIPSY